MGKSQGKKTRDLTKEGEK